MKKRKAGAPPKTRNYITSPLNPDSKAGNNSHGAKTNGEWLKATVAHDRRYGRDKTVVVQRPDGMQQIALAGDVHPDDRQVFPGE